MSQKRSALGRGLGALISSPARPNPRVEAPPAHDRERSDESTVSEHTHHGVSMDAVGDREASESTGLQSLAVDSIDPNPDQPRREFNPEALRSLADSIGEHGVLQPVVVRRAGERFELIMGERRFRASQLAGRKTVPAIILDIAPADRLELAIIENVQRQDLNPIELALAYRALAEVGHTQAEIGDKVSLDRSSISNHLRLLELSSSIQAEVENGRLSMGHAKALLSISDESLRDTLAKRIQADGLSVRASEKAARELNAGGVKPQPSGSASAGKAPPLDPDTRAFLDRIERHLQTKVQLRPGPKGSGKLEINYFNLEDLERLGQMLLGTAE